MSFPAGSQADEGIVEEDQGVISDLSEDLKAEDELSEKLKIFGWMDAVYKDNSKKDNKQYFDAYHFYLIADIKLNDTWRGFAEMEYEHAPNTDVSHDEDEDVTSQGKIKLERSYIQLDLADEAQFRFGKYNTPLGIWVPTHWAIYVDTTAKPIHEAKKYVSSKQVGVQFLGNWFPSEIFEMSYSLYTSNGSEQADQFGTNKPSDDRLAYGSDFRITLMDDYLLGYSTNLTKSPSNDRMNKTHMLYSEIQLPFDVLLRAAYFYQIRDHGFDDIETYYAKIKYSFLEKWYVNYRIERGTLVSSEKYAGREVAHVMTLAYWPLNSVRTRLEFVSHNFEENKTFDYIDWSVWIGLLF